MRNQREELVDVEGCESDRHPPVPAVVVIRLADSDSHSNYAPLCSACAVHWLRTLTPGESWEVTVL